MAFPDRRTADVLLTILFVAAVCAAIYSARRIILIFILAVFFAYLIDPVVKLQRHSLFFRNLRGPAVVEVYLAFVTLIALVGYAFAPGVARNTVKLVDEVPVLLDGLSTGDIAADEREIRLE